MSRVEPAERPEPRQSQQDRRSAPRRTPGKAEGEERDVEEALRHQDEHSTDSR